jgi:hypothetical protein
VRVGVYLANLDDFVKMDAIYREYFEEPRPARTTVGVILRGFAVEIDAVIGIRLVRDRLGAAVTFPTTGSGTPLWDSALPVMVLKDTALKKSLSVMAQYAREHGFRLAPQGKTTMAPQLFHRQLDAGAEAITAQATVAFAAGAKRVLETNEIVGHEDTRAIVDGRTVLLVSHDYQIRARIRAFFH